MRPANNRMRVYLNPIRHKAKWSVLCPCCGFQDRWSLHENALHAAHVHAVLHHPGRLLDVV